MVPSDDAWPFADLVQPPTLRAAGTSLFVQGETPGGVHFIQEGICKLVRTTASGQRIVVGLRGPGSLLGAAAAVMEQEHLTTCEALTRVLVRTMPTRSFHELRARDAAINCWLVRMLAREQAHQTLGAAAASLSVPQRLIQLVVLLSEECPFHRDRDGSAHLQITLRKSELAEIIGVSRETVSRASSTLFRSGIVQFRATSISVPTGSRLLPKLSSTNHALK